MIYRNFKTLINQIENGEYKNFNYIFFGISVVFMYMSSCLPQSSVKYETYFNMTTAITRLIFFISLYKTSKRIDFFKYFFVFYLRAYCRVSLVICSILFFLLLLKSVFDMNIIYSHAALTFVFMSIYIICSDIYIYKMFKSIKES